MFELEDDLLLVAPDHLSACDIVFEEGIPDKGRVLTGLTDFWFDRLDAARPHHRISTDMDALVAANPTLASHPDALAGRTMLCIRARPIPVDCVVCRSPEGSTEERGVGKERERHCRYGWRP